jgi:addiction module HigA family antidote
MSHTEERLPNPHPGDIIRHDWLEPLRMTPYRLAKGLGMTPSAVHDILNHKRAVTAATALKLSAFLGCSAGFWMNLQASYDMEEARRDPKLAAQLAKIERYPVPADLVLPDEETERAAA